METLPSTCIVSSRYHVECCSFSPSGELLAACFGDYSVRLLRISERGGEEEGEKNASDHAHSAAIQIDLEWVIREHRNSVWCVRFSPDGRLMCTCSSDNTAKLWDLKSQTLARTFEAHSATVWACCFSPVLPASREGVVVATGSSDKTVKLWDAGSGKILCDLVDHGDAVDHLSFSTCGELLCTSSRDGVVKIWSNLCLEKRLEISESSDTRYPEPVCLALTAVNNSASRFCMFSNTFRPQELKSDSTTTTSSLDDRHILPKINPSELLFAGGPNNTISVWSVRDISKAFSNIMSEGGGKTSQSCDDSSANSVGDIIQSQNGEHECSVSVCEEKSGGHEILEYEECCDGTDLSGEAGQSAMEQYITRIEAIAEEGMSLIEETPPNTTEHETETEIETDQELEGSNPWLERSANIPFANGSTPIADEMFFYKVKPRWILSDHLNTVWECCTTAICNSELANEIRSERVDPTISLNNTQVLASCSSDRTIRYVPIHAGSDTNLITDSYRLSL